MFTKVAVLACILAVANAGDLLPAVAPAAYAAPAYSAYAAPAYSAYAAPAYSAYAAPAYSAYAAPAIAATSQNVYRSPGNLHSISTHTKSIATPFSSSNKHVTTVTNPGLIATPVAYAAAAPVAHATYAAAPAPLAYSAPVAHAAPVVAHAAPAVAYSPAAAVSHLTYSSPVGINYSW